MDAQTYVRTDSRRLLWDPFFPAFHPLISLSFSLLSICVQCPVAGNLLNVVSANFTCLVHKHAHTHACIHTLTHTHSSCAAYPLVWPGRALHSQAKVLVLPSFRFASWGHPLGLNRIHPVWLCGAGNRGYPVAHCSASTKHKLQPVNGQFNYTEITRIHLISLAF